MVLKTLTSIFSELSILVWFDLAWFFFCFVFHVETIFSCSRFSIALLENLAFKKGK